MGMPQMKDYGMDELEQGYHQVTELYEIVGELVDLVRHPDQTQPDAQLALVAPLIDEVTDAADVLTEEYLLVAKGARFKMSHTASKTRTEGALRRIYLALDDYSKRSARAASRIGQQMKDITDAVVDKIHRQVEKVVGILVEFMTLSLSSIMNKSDLDQLRQRETRVAFMLHQMSQQGQGSAP